MPWCSHIKLEDYKEHLKGRILSTTVVIKGVNITILNGYAPTDEAPIASKQLFYRSLAKAKADLAKSAPTFKLVTLGDFNATISLRSKDSGAWDSVLGSNNSDKVNTTDNGERFLAWCLEHQMKIMNFICR